MTNTDSFALIQFPQYPKLQASDLLDIQFDSSQTTIKTADLTYEGQGVKSTDLCGVLIIEFRCLYNATEIRRF